MKLGRRRRASKIASFVLTQDQSIWNQLVYGIRFLDIRIGYYSQVKEKEDLRWVIATVLESSGRWSLFQNCVTTGFGSTTIFWVFSL